MLLADIDVWDAALAANPFERILEVGAVIWKSFMSVIAYSTLANLGSTAFAGPNLPT